MDRITDPGGMAVALSMNVSHRDDLVKVVDAARQHHGHGDVLVSCAGAMPIGPLDDLALDDWDQMIDVNLQGGLYGIAAALPVFRQQGSGHFVNCTSTAAHKTTPNQTIYSATKAAA